ncbi:MAG: hypothetical protein DME22_00330 [Verrucomicrobia bacterium]|nr:MAG: hypothetical protein DME22_00330 [Verrucomicrobiota bacterium]PYK00010.1 MAG: hypothetical protein DME23_08345 [Verrucomicrobiota bacterium]
MGSDSEQERRLQATEKSILRITEILSKFDTALDLQNQKMDALKDMVDNLNGSVRILKEDSKSKSEQYLELNEALAGMSQIVKALLEKKL